MFKAAVVTIVSANYLAYAKTLMESLAASNPDYSRYVVVVESDSNIEISSNDLFTVLPVSILNIETFLDMSIRYDVMELNTAVKPFALEWIFENTDATHAVYLDPDIFVYRQLSELNKILIDGASVVVTPHITKSLSGPKTPHDHSMLQAGVFNLGFIAFSRNKEAIDFIKWWSDRLLTQCESNISASLFTDQKWVDLAPCFVEKCVILRNPAYNVAYWNIPTREACQENGAIHLNRVPLAFFHFSGLDKFDSLVVSKHQNRLHWSDIKSYHNIFERYRQALIRNGWLANQKYTYSFDSFQGLKIAALVRRLYRARHPDSVPSETLNAFYIVDMCKEQAELPYFKTHPITRLMYQAYQEREDLQRSFDLRSEAGQRAFLEWFRGSARQEYKIDKRLMAGGNQASIASQPVFVPAQPPHPHAGKPWMYREWRKFRKVVLRRIS